MNYLKCLFYLYFYNAKISRLVNSKWNIYGETHFEAARTSFSGMTSLYIAAICFFIYNFVTINVVYKITTTIVIVFIYMTIIEIYIAKHWNRETEADEFCAKIPRWLLLGAPIFCVIIGIILLIISLICHFK